MIEKILAAYNGVVDRYELSIGYVPKDEVDRTFGGVPKLSVGLVIAGAICIFNEQDYVNLGPYKVPYEKIREAKQKGETRVVFTDKDFSGGPSIFNFGELERLQQEAQTTGKDCLVKDLELVLDDSTIFPFP